MAAGVLRCGGFGSGRRFLVLSALPGLESSIVEGCKGLGRRVIRAGRRKREGWAGLGGGRGDKRGK